MPARLLADFVIVAHFGFLVFVFGGGLLALRWPRAAWFHLPAVAWAVFIELTGTICPLTPLENDLRRAAGETGYSGGFVENYLLTIVYPDGLTRTIQLVLAVLVVAVNVAIYATVWRQRRRS